MSHCGFPSSVLQRVFARRVQEAGAPFSDQEESGFDVISAQDLKYFWRERGSGPSSKVIATTRSEVRYPKSSWE